MVRIIYYNIHRKILKIYVQKEKPKNVAETNFIPKKPKRGFVNPVFIPKNKRSKVGYDDVHFKIISLSVCYI